MSTEQLQLADYERQLAEGGRDHGLEAAARADGEWLDKVLDHLEHLDPGSETSADEIRHRFGSSSAMGAAFRTACRRGWIVPIGHRTSSAPSRHRGEQRVWTRA